MRVVCNASPLASLARIDALELLRHVFGHIVIPQAVWNEVVVCGSGQPGAEAVKTAQWIARHPTQNASLVSALRQDLDAGEAEAIVLALEMPADLLLMDERLGRETARHLGIRMTGLVGVLVESKRRGIIPAVSPILQSLRERAGFRLSDALYRRILQDVHEN